MFEPTLQPTQVRHLAQMLTPFDDEMAEHSPNGVAWAPHGIRTPLKIRRGQPIEILQRGAADGLVVCQAACDGEPGQGGDLLHCVAETVVLDRQSQLLVPGIALPYFTGVLGEGMHLTILVTRHVPHDKVNVIGVRLGLKAALGCGEPGEGFPQPIPIFSQAHPYDVFAVHICLLPLGDLRRYR